MKLDRKLRMGLIGGGPGAFIGEVHRKASRLDGEIELVAGAFDIDPKKSQETGKNLALDPKRVYNTYQDMIKANAQGYFPYTPAATLLRGLRASVDMLMEEG